MALIAFISSPCTSASIDGVPTNTAGFAGMAADGPLDVPMLVQSWEEFVEVFGGHDSALRNPYLAHSVSAFFANGGRRLYVVRVADDGDAEFTRALEGLQAIEEISVVCIPGVTSPAVQDAMILHCEDSGDRVCVLDPERDAGLADVGEQRGRLRSDKGYAALYYPWVQASPAGAGRVLLPPSGFVAGVYARTDRERGVWNAPVDEVLTAVDVNREISERDLEVLTAAGVNAIRSFPGRGVQVWGARTIATDGEWKFVSVRRYAIFLEESIHEGTQWAVFEPNDEPLWASVKGCVGDFLQTQWRAGALQGATPEEAFFVRVDRSTMTQEDLDHGRTVILVGAAVLRPAEFVLLRFIHAREAARFRRGDANDDGTIDVSDAIRILGFLFLGDDAPPCPDAADATDEGELSMSAAVYVLSFLFQGGPRLPPPFPDCGEDATEDPLGGCEGRAGACG